MSLVDGPASADSPNASSAQPDDKRRTPRFPLSAMVRLCWMDGREVPHSYVPPGFDLSERGIAVEMAEPLPVGLEVDIQLPNSRLGARGVVRRCQRASGAWRLGIELTTSFSVV